MDGNTKAAVAEDSSLCEPEGLRAASAASTKDGVDSDFGCASTRAKTMTMAIPLSLLHTQFRESNDRCVPILGEDDDNGDGDGSVPRNHTGPRENE